MFSVLFEILINSFAFFTICFVKIRYLANTIEQKVIVQKNVNTEIIDTVSFGDTVSIKEITKNSANFSVFDVIEGEMKTSFCG